MSDTDAFFTPAPTGDYHFEQAVDGSGLLTFPSALVTPHRDNNTVRCRYFPARTSRSGPKAGSSAAVLVMPQWNADPDGHVGLCRLLAWNGMSALRLSLPYHDQRMPPELHRADYIVSANVARTVQVCRQAVLDARRAIGWLASHGYSRIGILGTSLGSCLALLTAAHEPLIRAEALNHISPLFADVVWRGLSTRHVRDGLEGHIELDLLRALWKPISPQWYLERLRDRQTLLVYARYDLTFPRDLSEDLVRAFREGGIPHEVAVLRCGHYSTGKTPFKYVDGWVLTRFLKRALINSEV
jgi:dienelactone hydrolase